MFTNLFFYVPIYYFIHSRISSLSRLISWGIIYIVPTFWIQYHYSGLSVASAALLYFFQLLLVYNLYEVGYIENDAETIKREENPTMRLSTSELAFYEKRKWSIYLTRLLWTVLLLTIICKLAPPDASFWIYAAVVLCFVPLYLIYNRVRSQLTLFLHFLLVVIRFLSYPLLFISFYKADSLLLLFVFPIINLLERASQKRFKIPALQFITSTPKNLNSFRMVYYMILALLSVLASVYVTPSLMWMSYLFIYFAVYRTMIVAGDRLKKGGIR
jgi:hypothetical protein